METLAELPFIGDQFVCLSHDQARPQRKRGLRGELLAELEAFAAAVRGERAYPIPPEDILHGVAVFEAIVRSAERHQPIAVMRT